MPARNARGQFVSAKPVAARPDTADAPENRAPLGGDVASDSFLSELQASWSRHGARMIEEVRTSRPHDYLRLMASSLTKISDAPADAIEAMTDDEIAEELRRILGRIDAPGAEAGTRAGAAEQA